MSKSKIWLDSEHRWIDADVFDGQREERSALVKSAAQNFEAEKAEAEQKRVADDIAAHETELKAALKTAYTKANGGSEIGFTEAYPRLRSAHVEAQTLANVATKPATAVEKAEKTLKTLYIR